MVRDALLVSGMAAMSDELSKDQARAYSVSVGVLGLA
jgi:hypothetical protein